MWDELELGDLEPLRVTVVSADPLVRGALQTLIAGAVSVVESGQPADAFVWDLGVDASRAPAAGELPPTRR